MIPDKRPPIITYSQNSTLPDYPRKGTRQDERTAHLDIVQHAIDIQSDRVLVVIPVVLHLQFGILEDGGVVTPRRAREVDGLGVWVEPFEESSSNAEGTGSGDRLGDGDLCG